MAARLSMTPAAVRKRKRRAAERESRAASMAAGKSYAGRDRAVAVALKSADDDWAVMTPPRVPASVFEPVTLSETVPVKGPGADAFVMSSPEEPAATSAPWEGPAPEPASVPLVEPTPPPPAPGPTPPPPVNEATVVLVSEFVAGFFATGVGGILATSPEFEAFIVQKAGSPAAAMAGIVKATTMVRESAATLCRKYNISFKYQDEAIVVVALGIGGFGIARQRKMMAAVAAARDATPAPESAAASEPEVVPVDPSTAPPAMPAPGVRLVPADEAA